jgi:hypothetical protein
MYSCFTYPCFTGTSVCWFPWQTFESCWYICRSSFCFVSMFLFHCCLCFLNLLIRHLIVNEVGGFNPNSYCHVCCSEDILYSSILLTYLMCPGTTQSANNAGFPFTFLSCSLYNRTVCHNRNTNGNVTGLISVLLCFHIVIESPPPNVVKLFILVHSVCVYFCAVFHMVYVSCNRCSLLEHMWNY